MQHIVSWRRCLIILLDAAMTLALPLAIRAQQPSQPEKPAAPPANSPSQGDSTNGQPDQTAASTNESNQGPPHAPVAPASPLFRLAGGDLLTSNQSPLRLGPIYVGSAEAFGAFDRFTPSTNGLPMQSENGAVFRTDIILDQVYKTTRLTAQWEPHLTYIEGVARGDSENVNVDVQSTFQLSPRLGMTLSDRFGDIASRLLYGDFFSAGTVETPAVQQNSFLDTPGHALTEQAKAMFEYKLSQLTSIGFTPSFNYFNTNTTSALLNSSREYTGQLALSHIVSPRTTIGIGYDVSAVQFQSSANTTFYHTITGTYTRLLTPSLSVNAAAGLATFATPGNPRSWTFAGSAILLKSFRSGSVSVGYNRGLYLSDYTTSAFTDRVDGQAQLILNPRISVQAGGGFQREARTGGFQGRYAEGVVYFRIVPTVSLYTRYTFSSQAGDQVFLLTGTRNLYVVGLRWDAGMRPSH